LAKGALEQLTVRVIGEVSELSDRSGYKAVYFTLTDESSALACLMWRSAYAQCGLKLTKGMLVEAVGSFTVYAAKGRMNFSIKALRQAGEGDLRVKVAELARRLEAEGLMDPARKLSVPELPRTVAVVTSPRGKAVHDVLRTLRRRFPLAEALVFGVTVEGKDAPSALSGALRAAQESHADVVLLVRGGGSYEDLMPFNDELVARTVAASRIPVVTGIGHEPDNTLADMVASHRSSTPTAAAEYVVPDAAELEARLRAMGTTLRTQVGGRLAHMRLNVAAFRSRPLFCDDGVLTDAAAQGLEQAALRLSRALPSSLASSSALAVLLAERLRFAAGQLTAAHAAQLGVLAGKLEALSPLAVLARGYSVAFGADGHVVDSVEKTAPGDAVIVRLADGMLDCVVSGVRPGDADRIAAGADRMERT
jgi:exodeoxyribonuclease VII large subunit